MKPNTSFKYVRRIGGILFLLLFLGACQKNLIDSKLESKSSNVKYLSDLHSRIINFASHLKTKKSGQLHKRTDDPMYPADVNDLVEGTMNYNYCDASILFWNTKVDDTTIVAPMTNGQISGENIDELYDNVHAFAKYRFGLIEDEHKTPRAYDLEISSTGTNSVTFSITSIVGYGTIYTPYSRKTFGAGYYEADPGDGTSNNPPHLYCGQPNGSWRNAPELMMQFINYNLLYTISPNYFTLILRCGCHTDMYDNNNVSHALAWRFPCSNNYSCCRCSNACSGYNLVDVYCLDQSDMNGYLTEFEDAVTNDAFFIPNNDFKFTAITAMGISHLCNANNDIRDVWYFDMQYGHINTDWRQLLEIL